MDTPPQPDGAQCLRTTQRAPKSCVPCATRKLRCDKHLPCARCVKQGDQAKCVRETVMVRGQVTTARSGEKGKAYAELVAENERLRRSLSQFVGGSMRALWSQNAMLGRHSCSAEEALFDATASHKRDNMMSWDQISVPIKSVSDSLIAHDERWNSWVHYAINHQAFTTQHDTFFADLKEGRALQSTQPSWLALYFSVLSVGCQSHRSSSQTLTVGAVR